MSYFRTALLDSSSVNCAMLPKLAPSAFPIRTRQFAPPSSRAGKCLKVHAAPFKNWFDSFKPKPLKTNEAGDATGIDESGSGSSSTRAPTAKRDFLEARQVSIYQLIDSDEFRFDIPLYQRPYSWGTKQVYELLQDLITAYRAEQEYFLGAVVTTRKDEAPGTPYQVIDGQQRLTSIFIMLAFFHSWAKENQNQVLEARVQRMLHIEADPLDSSSESRYRLKLRDSDNDFFVSNILKEFLPATYELTGVAESDAALPSPLLQEYAARNGQGETNGSSPHGVQELENESHWRLYESAKFMQTFLSELSSNGELNLQEFMNHCLRNCYLVMMTARDERASFRIFSTLNGRGMDISEVDKLKADMLEVLEPSDRKACSQSWAEVENVLGRKKFDRVFTHMKDLASVLEPEVGNLTVLEYFNRRRLNSAATVARVIQVALSYSRIMIQIRQNRWGAVGSSSSADLSSEVAAMQQQSGFMNLFTDECWLPATLEFFMQVDSMPKRLSFLKAAEALQLFLEVEGNPSMKASRWRTVSLALFERPLNSERVIQAMELSDVDRLSFFSRLDARDLFTRTDARTIAHVLLRAEASLSRVSMPLDGNGFEAWRQRLHVNRIMPATAPEGSQWRKTKLQGGSLSGSEPSSGATTAESSGSETESSSTPTDAKYWYDMQRMHWHAKLGNLILYAADDGGMAHVETEDYDVKAGFLRSNHADSMFPKFSGAVIAEKGAYAGNKFSFEECRQRHYDIMDSLKQQFLPEHAKETDLSK